MCCCCLAPLSFRVLLVVEELKPGGEGSVSVLEFLEVVITIPIILTQCRLLIRLCLYFLLILFHLQVLSSESHTCNVY